VLLRSKSSRKITNFSDCKLPADNSIVVGRLTDTAKSENGFAVFFTCVVSKKVVPLLLELQEKTRTPAPN
jgi:hypothetical protein